MESSCTQYIKHWKQHNYKLMKKKLVLTKEIKNKNNTITFKYIIKFNRNIPECILTQKYYLPCTAE